MSEKPVASIKTLARYEPEAVYIGTGEYVAECVRADDGDYYLAADVDAAIEALQAEIDALRTRLEDTVRDSTNEIEALRAEVERSERYAEQSERERLWAEARAERMAEALREAADMLLADYPETARRLRATLNPAAAQEGKESFWPKLPGSGGPDWTGHD